MPSQSLSFRPLTSFGDQYVDILCRTHICKFCSGYDFFSTSCSLLKTIERYHRCSYNASEAMVSSNETQVDDSHNHSSSRTQIFLHVIMPFCVSTWHGIWWACIHEVDTTSCGCSWGVANPVLINNDRFRCSLNYLRCLEWLLLIHIREMSQKLLFSL